MNINKLINNFLKENNILEYDLGDINKIIMHCLNLSRNEYYLKRSYYNISKDEENKVIEDLSKLYISKIPLQYILGYQYFYNEKYFVNPSVLIPRQDTEILVSEAIKYINNENFKTCIDLCAGSGCIGISISKNSNIEKVYLVDISQVALKVAKENIKHNNALDKCKTICSDYLDKIRFKVDIIVSNPPYIKREEITKLDEYVKKEPIIALDGGVSGIEPYRIILKEARRVLNENGIIIFEIGFDEKLVVKEEIEKYTCYEYIDTIKDLENRDRVVVCRFHQK